MIGKHRQQPFFGITLTAATVAISLLLNGCKGDSEYERAEKQVRDSIKARVELKVKLQAVAQGVEMFQNDFGCVPFSVDDLRAKPSATRLQELGCSKDGAQASEHEYIGKLLYDDVRTWLRIVKRWDGVYALAWDEPSAYIAKNTMYCSVLDAMYGACPSQRR